VFDQVTLHSCNSFLINKWPLSRRFIYFSGMIHAIGVDITSKDFPLSPDIISPRFATARNISYRCVSLFFTQLMILYQLR
jgi:hypothetical protein